MKVVKYTSCYMLNGGMIEFVQYDQDVGSLHVLDRLLYLACKPWQDGTYGPCLAPNEIWLTFRDLDNEEEREGLYR